ncbi:thiol-disulfide oxidoreductase DCC family protein [Pelagovum pacificum]|uniref:DUF393 domain-containing protein n=2 Tax=Pelagovum pacificum TaxID=2588711 RepID=A0A5C5GAR7_9RHOB|nr:DCC1-like thiol-disulfide oxidoreductase family protein [Pelagovum pacificum]QQA41299.1 DUF393 domain-containing protein [Pelagovum pacificum]TNY31895.1 DUF393 domain-containing protein [Pelagovum pacificum]
MRDDTIVIFDTDCVLCSGAVGFLLRHEADTTIRFASSRTETGARLAEAHGLSAADLDLTFLMIRDDNALTRSDAALCLAGHLRRPWRWLRVLRVVPRPLRDAIYGVIARNRLRWFGQRDSCFLPPPAQAHRFLDRPGRL